MRCVLFTRRRRASQAEGRHHARSAHHVPQGTHHSKKSLLSVDKRDFFVGARNGTWSRSAELGPYADLTVPRTVIQYRSRFKPRYNTLQNKKPSNWMVFILVRETGLEPVRLPTRPSNVRVCRFRHSRI